MTMCMFTKLKKACNAQMFSQLARVSPHTESPAHHTLCACKGTTESLQNGGRASALMHGTAERPIAGDWQGDCEDYSLPPETGHKAAMRTMLTGPENVPLVAEPLTSQFQAWPAMSV